MQHEIVGPFERADLDAVTKVLHHTGLVRQPTLVSRPDSVILWMVVRAESAKEAAHAAERIADVAHREAGHELTLGRTRCSAVPHRQQRPGDDQA